MNNDVYQRYAELVDIYRTLADLSRLGPVEQDVQGTSLAPLFDDPTDPSLDGKVALSQFARCCSNTTKGYICSHCVTTPRSSANGEKTFDFMGYSLRSPRGWRYTEWRRWNGTAIAADWSKVL